VLVDSSHEEQLKRFAALPAPSPGVVPQPVSPEKIDLAGASADLAKAPWRADIPLVVLSRGLWFTTPPITPDPQADARLAIWQELHRELATRSAQSELVVASHSGHYIQNDEPALVIDAIRRVVLKTTNHP
jgi:pimeloyl-ACP methyl ester carboxylesterase